MDENELIVFEEQYESFKNGNITEFIVFLETSDGQHIYNFIKWLQENNLKL